MGRVISCDSPNRDSQWARKLKLFDAKRPDIGLAGLQGKQLDESWRKWIHQEEKRR